MSKADLPGGYMGRILKVDLSRGKIVKEDLKSGFLKKYIGGAGTAGKILYDTVPSWADAFDPINRLIFSTGPITGTPVPGAARFTVVSKSPLTGYFGDASAGGYWGPELKFAGYDMVVISGKAPTPVFLRISDGEVDIEDASSYWGMDIRDAERSIRKDFDDKKIQVAGIGQGGENLVRFACVMHDNAGRAAGRCGMGAIMGSKNLKAVTVRGSRSVPAANLESIKELSRELSSYFKNNAGVKTLRNLGTQIFFRMWFGDFPVSPMPTENFSKENFGGSGNPKAMKILDDFNAKNLGSISCYRCPIACRTTLPREYAAFETEAGLIEAPESQNMCALGPNCGIGNIDTIIEANDLCNVYSLDTDSTGNVIAFAMECYERGLISQEDTGGIDLRFGNDDALIKIIHKIAKREAFGNLLAEGTRRSSMLIGQGSDYFAIQTKGLELAMNDPRNSQGASVFYAGSLIGGDHLEGSPLIAEKGSIFKPVGIKATSSRFSTKDKGVLAKKMLDYYAFLNATGICMNAKAFYGEKSDENVLNMLFYVTGLALTGETVLHIGERINNVRRAFGIKHGCSNREDTLPGRLLKENFEGIDIRLDKTLPEYYRVRGWDPKTGKPTKKKLEELDLSDIAQDLWS